MSDTLIFALGSGVFAITTLASLWVGYLLMQRHWVEENPGLTDEGDHIRPLFTATYPEQRPTRETGPFIPVLPQPPTL